MFRPDAGICVLRSRMHYRAFISHSHADAKFAAWLQRAIETWRVPTRLRAELGYSRIKPIFLSLIHI